MISICCENRATQTDTSCGQMQNFLTLQQEADVVPAGLYSLNHWNVAQSKFANQNGQAFRYTILFHLIQIQHSILQLPLIPSYCDLFYLLIVGVEGLSRT